MQTTNVIKAVKIVDTYVSYLYDQKSKQIYILSNKIASWAQIFPLALEALKKPEVVKAYLPPADDSIYVDAYSIVNIAIGMVTLKDSEMDSFQIALLEGYLMSIMHAVSDDWYKRDKGNDFLSTPQLRILKRIIIMKQNEVVSTTGLTPMQALYRIDTLIRENFAIRIRGELRNTELLSVIGFITKLDTGSLVGANYENRA